MTPKTRGRGEASVRIYGEIPAYSPEGFRLIEARMDTQRCSLCGDTISYGAQRRFISLFGKESLICRSCAMKRDAETNS